MSDQNHEILLELRRRTTRIESRLCRLADHAGVNVGSPVKDLRVVKLLGDTVVLDTPALDVTLSEVIHFLHKEGMGGKVAYVQFGGQHVATIIS